MTDAVRNRTILVVDDVADVRQMLVVLLTDAGYNVLSAATVPDAIRLVESSAPDLLLIDIRMGDYNGLQVAMRERARQGTASIILMSGYEDPVLIAEAERLGAIFIAKPFEPSDLLDRMERLLRDNPRDDLPHQ